MDLNLVSWNSLNINNGTPFRAFFPPGTKVNLSANAITVNRAAEFPALSGVVMTPNVLTIQVIIATGQDTDVNRELLKKYFNITDQTRRNLIATDADDSDRQWYVTGFPVRIVPEGGSEKISFLVTIQLEVPYWRVVTALTSTLAATASGQTDTITNIGNIAAKPIFTLTPTLAKTGGVQYRRWVPIYNNLDTSYIDAVDITGGGLDTAALTTAKMQADGDDFLVWLDGALADRWLNAMDSAATKAWVNYDLAPRHEGTTNVSLGATTAATDISFSRTRANLQFLQHLKRQPNRVLLIDSEAFLYTAANVDTFNYKITGCTREAKGTTAAAHAEPKTVRHIEHDLWILYGDSTLTTPDVDDDNKPIFDLDSTNAVRGYSSFYDTRSARPGAWKGGVVSTKSGLSYVYTGDENVFTNPSVELGLAIIGSSVPFNNQAEAAVIEWLYTHPAGIDSIVYSGSKYTTDTDSFPAVMGLQYLQPDTIWGTQESEAAPSTENTWEAFGPHTETLPASYNAIRFAVDGAITATAGAAALIQFDTVDVTLTSANLPTIAVGSELAAYYFDIVISNNTTGESLRVSVPCGLNETLTIDCESKQAYLSDGGRVNVELSSDREAWLDLVSGANTIAFTDTGLNAVTIQTSHRDRTL